LYAAIFALDESGIFCRQPIAVIYPSDPSNQSRPTMLKPKPSW
jgi:hypothetical protein